MSLKTLEIESWQMVSADAPLALRTREVDLSELTDEQVVVRVAGCGVCHTDLGFFYDGVRTRHPLPLTLGHEIAGTVEHAGSATGLEAGMKVVVPAVIPCGECDPCKAGRGAVCPAQVFPGSDDHGGFASHVIVPGRGLCRVDDQALAASGIDLADLAVVADAITTPYQAIVNSGLRSGDVAIFIGIGGVGGFGVQLASALGAHVAALDVDPARLARIAEHGAEITLAADGDARAIRKTLSGWAKDNGLPRTGWKIFETSGHPAGQELAFSLLGYDGHLAVVGFTRDKINVRLSNLMAFDATARGTWGCLPEHYPAVVDLVLSGRVSLGAFTEQRPMSAIADTFEALRQHQLDRRPVLIPDFA